MIDEHSDTWKAVKAWADEKIAEHQRALEEFGLSEKDTEGHRYAIYDLRLLVKISAQAKNALSIEPSR